MDNSHIFNEKIYWEIGATTPFFCLEIRKTTPIGCPLVVMGVVA
jgi:hypothetical protein